ncbi:MAG: hypothetical protein M1831_006681 [Alyxoria varia]|nr:MAG: hypothetical protein M1831_006681 [Alyxoria varia]
MSSTLSTELIGTVLVLISSHAALHPERYGDSSTTNSQNKSHHSNMPSDDWSLGPPFLYHLPGTSEFNASIIDFLESVRTQTATDAEFRAFLHMLCYNSGVVGALTPILKNDGEAFRALLQRLRGEIRSMNGVGEDGIASASGGGSGSGAGNASSGDEQIDDLSNLMAQLMGGGSQATNSANNNNALNGHNTTAADKRTDSEPNLVSAEQMSSITENLQNPSQPRNDPWVAEGETQDVEMT